MKKLFTALLLLVGFVSFSQTKGYFRYDSIQFEKVGGNAEFILLNSTRNVTNGVLTNLGNGRTGFVVPSGSGGLSGGNLGSGYRVYYPPLSGNKSLFAGTGQLIDSSSNSNGLTFKVDTTAIQPKNLSYASSLNKNGVTVTLDNDNDTPPDTSFYGYNGTKGWKDGAVIDVTTGSPGQYVKYINGQLFGLGTPTASGTSPPTLMRFRPGLWPYPSAGDSIFVCDSINGKGLQVYRGGVLQFPYDGTEGYTHSNDTLYVHPPWVSGERDQIFIYDNPFDTAAVCAAPVTWTDLTIGTNTGTLINTSHVWTTTGSFGWANYGLDALRLTGDGSIRAQYVATDGHEFVLGFNATNSSQDYTNYEYGVYVASSGALSKVVNGTSSSISYSLSVGDYVRINRTGSTFKIQSSPDGNTWTDRWTFVATSSATHYVNLDIYQTGKCYYPQGFGLNSLPFFVALFWVRRRRNKATHVEKIAA